MSLNSVINTGALGSSYIITDGAGLLSATGGILITKYTASGTWTKNIRTKVVLVYSWNGGGGGGSGRQGLTTAAGGGGAGSCGSTLVYSMPATWFNSTETVTIGGAGGGGTGQSSALTNGNPGTNGGVSSIGNVFASLVGNNLGAGGSTIASLGGSAQMGFQGGFAYYGVLLQLGSNGALGNPGNATIQAISGTGLEASQISPQTQMWPGNGGAGAGANSSVSTTGGVGGASLSFSTGATTGATIVAGGTGGQETGSSINGGNGNPFISTTGGRIVAASGGGGGGGTFVGLSAGNGGTGGVPGGGGGGGAGSLSAITSGTGGNGGRGELWVIEFL